MCLINPLISQQSTIHGKVVEKSGLPIIGANVSVVGSYDGGVTDLEGVFNFKTAERGQIKLQISYLGFETKSISNQVASLQGIEVILRSSAMTLDAVEITASTFSAGDNAKVAVLKPLDILTTAGSVGDVIAAMQTLPGTQANADDGRLFVRGGDARETSIYVDGLKVFSPYLRSVGGTPTRGRYSPLLFKGVSFSTGGYGSQFGQALSGVLDMRSIDEPAETMTNINLMTIGAGVGHTQKWKKQSLSINTNYTNLTPYSYLVPGRLNWEKPYSGFNGEAIYRYKTKKGIIKSYIAGDYADFELCLNDINLEADQLLDVSNSNLYGNISYSGFLDDKTSLQAGISIGYNSDKANIDKQNSIVNRLQGLHARLAAKTEFGSHLVGSYGIEILRQSDEVSYSSIDYNQSNNLERTTTAGYIEPNYYFTKNLAIKVGVRTEYQSLTKRTSVLPRLTLAQKLSGNSQISASYGRYSQSVESRQLIIANQLVDETATHYLLNYNLKNNNQIVRAEGYYKRYDNLITYSSTNNEFADQANGGDGYAYGIDLFWRSNNVYKNLDFWISYSWLENQRRYQDYEIAAPTRFSTAHNLSLVGKYFVEDWKTQISLTYRMASGRPYDNPNTIGFLKERSSFFNTINLSCAYLLSPQKIVFVSISNATNFKNNYGYEYANKKDIQGIYPSRLVTPNDDQFFFVGFFITMSKNKLNNQLNNL